MIFITPPGKWRLASHQQAAILELSMDPPNRRRESWQRVDHVWSPVLRRDSWIANWIGPLKPPYSRSKWSGKKENINWNNLKNKNKPRTIWEQTKHDQQQGVKFSFWEFSQQSFVRFRIVNSDQPEHLDLYVARRCWEIRAEQADHSFINGWNIDTIH